MYWINPTLRVPQTTSNPMPCGSFFESLTLSKPLHNDHDESTACQKLLML
jgi:hypothetical protein